MRLDASRCFSMILDAYSFEQSRCTSVRSLRRGKNPLEASNLSPRVAAIEQTISHHVLQHFLQEECACAADGFSAHFGESCHQESDLRSKLKILAAHSFDRCE